MNFESPDWNAMNPMANEGPRLERLEARFADHREEYAVFKREMKDDMKEIQRTVWKASGAFGFAVVLIEIAINFLRHQ